MEKYNVKFKKKYGQNFLKDKNIVKRIVDISGVDKNSLVCEVGPGGAILTSELANRAGRVVAYEIDKELEDELYKKLSGIDNVDILFQDFLDADLKKDFSNYKFDKLFFVSNVPYYITTPIIMKLIKSGLHFENIVMMVQKEVGERFSTLPGNRQYSSITVLLNYYYDIKLEFKVSRNNFVPIPNVDSVIVSFKEKDNKLELNDFEFFEKIIRDSFQFKRKTIKNNLKKYDLEVVSSVLEKFGFTLDSRAEMLGVEVFVSLANSLRK